MPMRWRRGRGRDQIEDRRGQGLGPGGLGGRGGGGLPIPLPRSGAGMGIGGTILIGIVVAVLFFTGVLGGGNDAGSGTGSGVAPRVPGAPDPDARLADFVGFVVDDVQDFWRSDFASGGRTYETTKLVLFTGQTQSACGLASSETGPFYCPADHKVYLDLGFFRELRSSFRAPGDFAEAYVIAH